MIRLELKTIIGLTLCLSLENLTDNVHRLILFCVILSLAWIIPGTPNNIWVFIHHSVQVNTAEIQNVIFMESRASNECRFHLTCSTNSYGSLDQFFSVY